MTPKVSTELNPLCAECIGKCKQPKSTLIISCPKFKPAPIQLEIKLRTPRKRKEK